MPPDPVRIAIAGGGTAGWMVAAALARFLDTGFAITLVESDDIGTIGVGEATIPQIRLFNSALGIDEDAFLRETQGSFKLAIEFVDWGSLGSRYMHAFGDIGRDVGLLSFQHYWARARQEGSAGALAAYSLNNMAASAEKMQRGPARTAKLLPDMPYAFHFDAGLYAQLLRRHAEAGGVTRIEGRIVDVLRHGEGGDVAALRLESGARVEADLFIDCSGFAGLLIEQALQTGYEDWTHWLPCDRAMAVPSERVADPLPYTRSTAHGAGWQWRIPLQHRTGNGLVYSSAHLDDAQAAAHLLANLDGAPLADPRPLRFTTGRRKQVWNRNVIAVGLSSGFLEPLESTSIHLIQSAISRLLKLLPGRRIADSARAEFNRQSRFEIERIRDFLILHYKASSRDDTDFWRMCRDMAVPDTLADKMQLFCESGHIVREHEELFTEAGWLQVFAGQGVLPQAHHPLADAISSEELADYMQTIAALNRREVAQMPGHGDFLRQHCQAPAMESRP